jgi:putative transposase
VFLADADYVLYLKLLRKYFGKYQIDMPGYSLMPNHTHEIAIPALPTSLGKGVGILHNDFSRWQQIQRNLNGHLWQNRFYSSPMDEDHFWLALRYIELNPVRAGLVQYAWDWPWSSAAAHVTGFDDTGLLNMDLWRSRFDGCQWKEFLKQGMRSEPEIERIRLATRTGRPLGSDAFIRQLELMTGRSLFPGKRGPKRGSKR